MADSIDNLPPEGALRAGALAPASAGARPRIQWRVGYIAVADPWRWVDPAALALFLNAGQLKDDPRLAWFPIDLTVASLAFVFLLAGRRVVLLREGIPRRVLWFVALFALLAVPILWTRWTPYSSEKVGRLFTLTMGVVLLAPILIRTREAIQRLLTCVVAISGLILLDSIYQLFTNPAVYAVESRLTTASANTIAVGRAVGMVIVAMAVIGTRTSLRRVLFAWAAAGVGAVTLLASGSRGPAVAAVLATLVGVLVTAGLSGRAATRLGGMLAVLAVAGAVGWTLVPEASATRMLAFAQTGLSDTRENQSATQRTQFWSGSIRYARVDPMGMGWGAFSLLPISGNQQDHWPHDLWIELALEAGWLSMLATLLLCGIALVRAIAFAQSTGDTSGSILTSFIVFATVNASVSGDINSNRILFTLASIACCASLPGVDYEEEESREACATA